MTSNRADVFLVEQGYAKTRAETRRLRRGGHFGVTALFLRAIVDR